MALSFFTSISFINRTDQSFPVISKPVSLPISCSLTSSSISSKFPMASAINHDVNLGHKWLDYSPNKLPDKNYVRIFDTTLRDGEQAPGAALTPSQKIEIAKQLSKLRVDIIEVGFPVSSKEDFETIKTIAKTVGNEVDEKTGYVPVLDVLSRCNKNDIETAWESVKEAKRPSITVFIATSDIHMKYKLKKTKQEVIEMAVNGVKYAKSLGFENIIFGCEDACRSEKEFLYEIMGETIKAGATTVGIADTVGITMPHEFGKFVSDVIANTPGIENVIFAVHCHNDLGVATANTLAAACAGARHLEVTINGIGERSGNAALEEVVMAMKCRGEYVMNGLYTNIDTKQIMATSKMVQEYTGLHVQAHKPIVGVNCFLHESGLHQDGMLKNRSTYEILSPEDIGIDTTNNSGIVLGKLSGRRALKDRLKELGYEIEDKKLNDIFSRFKELANQTKRITDADLKTLMVETNNINKEAALT